MHDRKAGQRKFIAAENDYQLYLGYETTGVEKKTWILRTISCCGIMLL